MTKSVDAGASDADVKEPVDLFGEENQAPPVQEEEDKAPEEDKGADEGDKKKAEDVDPRISALEDASKAKDDNIRAMRKRIKELERGDAAKVEVDLPYKNIKWAKDLTEDERSEMTENEIRQMEQIAEMQDRINKDVEKAHQAELEKAAAADEDDDDWGEEKLDKAETKTTARREALALAGGDKDVANEILAEFNTFNNEGLTSAEIKERIEKANKLRPDYEPPKVQPKAKTSKAAKGGGAGSDPFGNDAIVKAASSKSGGDVFSL